MMINTMYRVLPLLCFSIVVAMENPVSDLKKLEKGKKVTESSNDPIYVFLEANGKLKNKRNKKKYAMFRELCHKKDPARTNYNSIMQQLPKRGVGEQSQKNTELAEHVFRQMEDIVAEYESTISMQATLDNHTERIGALEALQLKLKTFMETTEQAQNRKKNKCTII